MCQQLSTFWSQNLYTLLKIVEDPNDLLFMWLYVFVNINCFKEINKTFTYLFLYFKIIKNPLCVNTNNMFSWKMMWTSWKCLKDYTLRSTGPMSFLPLSYHMVAIISYFDLPTSHPSLFDDKTLLSWREPIKDGLEEADHTLFPTQS